MARSFLAKIPPFGYFTDEENEAGEVKRSAWSHVASKVVRSNLKSRASPAGTGVLLDGGKDALQKTDRQTDRSLS